MDYKKYKNYVKKISTGKKLPGALYIHESVLDAIPKELRAFLEKTIIDLGLDTAEWNIIKFSLNNFGLSLLHYPDFFKISYPALHCSYTINLTQNTYRKTNYTKSQNPPILHRKEAFLLPDHPSVQVFEKITSEGEAIGLYENSKSIGFRKSWLYLIESKNYTLVNGRLQKQQSNKSKNIERHKTAIDRSSLSAPMQTLFRHNYLQGQFSVFDYGCGKGDDLNILANHNVSAEGWDPIYYPENKIRKSDIVNLGFVINVIENPTERRETLLKGYRISKKLLVISVMLGGESITNKFEKYGDGIITSRETFQKYYSQNEFREYLQDVLGETAIAIGPGIFYVFKDKLEEQHFLVKRQRLKPNWQKLSYTDHPERLKVKQRALYERHKDIFQEFWQQCLDFGRLPANNEFEKSEELRALCASHQKGLALLTTIHGQKPLTKATEARRDDLLIHYALGLFGQRKPYMNMPKRLKRDVKYFFGNYTKVIQKATKLLFSVGKPEVINAYCAKAYEKLGRGRLEPSQAFTIHKDDVELLPVQLRVYLGCATQLFGDIDSVDLVKIHIRSGKVSLMKYDDFEGKPLPLLLERIKIKLREQAIDFFKYGEKFEPQPLYLKSKYIHQGVLHYDKQVSLDKQLLSFSWINLEKYGPPIKELKENLENLEGLELTKFTFSQKQRFTL